MVMTSCSDCRGSAAFSASKTGKNPSGGRVTPRPCPITTAQQAVNEPSSNLLLVYLIKLHERTKMRSDRTVPLQPYRRVLALPQARTSMLLVFSARLPMTAMGITLTLHVVSHLGRGYGAAGLVGTATMVGTAISSPLLGRLIDRYGLRPVVAVCGACS